MERHHFYSDECFVCGKNNKDGLHLKIEKSDDKAIISGKIDKKFQSFKGVVHGGIISLLFDEVLWYAFYFQGTTTVTRKLEITFKRPLKTETNIICTGWVNKKLSETLFEGMATIEDEDGIIATARGTFFVKEDLKDKIVIFFDKT
ncbi:MAG: PaaI family thioesterase [Proteobacteria bacterium]|nr:PaaI family thioesterase [Pseudomonadota bacterium]